MNNVAIFSVYSESGKICAGDYFLLEELKRNTTRLLVVINGRIESGCRLKLANYADEIVLRDNCGFDAGGYKDVILSLLKNQLKEYDNLILCNNTFFGFFVPLSDILDKYYKNEYDVYGINYVDGILWPHIQSYFLVFSNKVLKTDDLISFFGRYNEKTLIRAEALVKFESDLYHTFLEKGYKFGYYVNTNNANIYSNADAILRFGLPLIKKKAFENKGIVERILEIKDYIEYMGYFDTSFIDAYFEEVKSRGLIPKEKDGLVHIPEITLEELLEFIIDNESVYLYGIGLIAQKIYYTIEGYKKRIKGFVVSDDQKTSDMFGIACRRYSQIDKESAIVVCLNIQNSTEVFPKLKDREKILWLWNAFNNT